MDAHLINLRGTGLSVFGLTPASTPGAPVAGTFSLGELWLDSDGTYWRCTGAGTPGTWQEIGSGDNDAGAIVFTPAGGISATNVQAAIEELDSEKAASGHTHPSTLASDTHAASSKAVPIDADEMPLVDSAASFGLKKLTWANLKATAKAYFDTLYALASHTHPASDIASGTIATTRLGSGSASSSTFLRGDQTWSAGGSSGITVKNTSGATANANDVGYIDAAGEYKTTTTANYTGSWCVVLTGAANGSDITVARSGRVTVNYTGTAPAAGDFLVTSTSAGLAAASTVMRPEIFARCTAAGSGGQVTALLLTGSLRQDFTVTVDTLRINSLSSTDFVATINGTPSGSTVTYNAPSSGAENTIVPVSNTQAGNIVLWNTTRNTSALIDSVNTGTNVITLTTSVPAGWANGDTITARSQTATGSIDTGTYLYELDLSGLNLPALTRSAEFYANHIESAPSGSLYGMLHPFQAVSNAFATGETFQGAVANLGGIYRSVMPIIAGKVCFAVRASGTGTSSIIIRARGVQVASP